MMMKMKIDESREWLKSGSFGWRYEMEIERIKKGEEVKRVMVKVEKMKFVKNGII